MIQIDMEMPKNCLDCNLRYQSFCSVDGHHEPHLEKERCPLKVTPQEPRWIPISEGLPDTDDEVLCWYEYYHWSQEKVLPEYGLGRYLRETSAWFGEVANGKDVRVIAWMSLPQPYREVEE